MRIESDHEFVEVTQAETDKTEKKRIKADGVTVDISVMDTGDLSVESFIERRKEILQDPESVVPDPYRFDTQEISREPEVEVDGRFASGYADHEFRIVSSDDYRYRYFVCWEEKEGKVVEKELYTGEETDRKEARQLLDSFNVSF